MKVLKSILICFCADIIDELKSASDLESIFRRIAKENSDCSSGQRGGKIISLFINSNYVFQFFSKGDLGMFGRGAMQKPFEDASFSLNVNQMSGVVDSDSGLHVILRIA